MFHLSCPSCCLFFQVDSVLSSREKYDDTTHGTLTSVKTTLMQEWDGLRTGGDRVVVIASTNRPFDLDEAVLRRLPRRILVDLPDAEVGVRVVLCVAWCGGAVLRRYAVCVWGGVCRMADWTKGACRRQVLGKYDAWFANICLVRCTD